MALTPKAGDTADAIGRQHYEAPTRALGWRGGAWRSLVERQVQRLEDELGTVSPTTEKEVQAVERIRASLNRARQVLAVPSTLVSWWSGRLVEAAWDAFDRARQDLILVEDGDLFKAETPYFAGLAARAGTHASTTWDPASSADRAAARQVVRASHIANSESHERIRQFRNFLLILTVITAMVTVIATIVDSGDRAVIAVGALAGAVATVLPLSTATALPGPYNLTVVQAVLRIPTGCVAAVLSVVLLRNGLAGLSAATGNTALFYAGLFGFSQTALLKLLDTQANNLVGAATPRTAGAAGRPADPRY